MATAVSISIRREAAMQKLAANAAGIGDSFPDLPVLDLTRKNKDNEIEQVSILERIADYLAQVQRALIAEMVELAEVLEPELELEPEPEPEPEPAAPTPPAPNKRKR